MADIHLANQILSPQDMVIRLGAGTLLGFAIGFERQLRQRSAGLHTSSLVTVGAVLFATIAPSFGAQNNFQIIANIVTGVGFLAGGVILKDGLSVVGLNTAATMWAAAAVGALTGVGLFYEAGLGAAVIIGLNALMGPLSAKVDHRVAERENAGHPAENG
jgi:putative Mg2+ transporter-C (MgtC) family protein